MTILGLIGMGQLLIIVFIALFVLLLPILALIDILQSNFEGNNKLIWVLIVIFMSLLGAILYFAIGRNQKV